MKVIAMRFEDFVIWQKVYQFVLQAVGGRFAGYSGF